MEFLFALLGYVAVIVTAGVTIMMSVATIFPPPPPPHQATEISAQASISTKPLSSRETTRQLARQAITRLR